MASSPSSTLTATSLAAGLPAQVRLSSGQILIRLDPGSTIPDTTARRFAIGVDRTLNEQDGSRLAALAGYANRALLNGSSIEAHVHDAHHSWLVVLPRLWARRSDPAAAWARFLDALPEMVAHGSPPRTTARSGPVGSRLVDGLGAGISVALYADAVADLRGAAFLQALGGAPTAVRLGV